MDNKHSYVATDNPKEFALAYNSSVDKFNGISTSFWSSFENISPGISGRLQFDRRTYEWFRPYESLPEDYTSMVVLCDNMYHRFTLVRNVIDLMSDFACQGIKLVHPVKNIERFYNTWFDKVNGFDRSERFLNYLYRHAMVVCEAQVTKISAEVEKDFKNLSNNQDIEPYVIPLNYIFHHPALVSPVDPLVINDDTVYQIELTHLSNNQHYLRSLQGFGFNGSKRVLPKNKVFVHYYKRDDWQVKPVPFLFPLLKHAIMLEKLSLADSAALDGAISSVRIFKLGNLEHKLAPTDRAVAKLDEILRSNVGGGTLDLIWGPDIELIESNTNVHQFLGEEKYIPHLHQMYIGLGIPPSLAGTGNTGTTNNYISIKVLTKRLQYGRRHLINFWTKQIKWIQKAMGFSQPAKIEFDFLDLGDEEAEKRLLIQMADRNLISDEKLQTIFGHDPDMEKARLNREYKERRIHKRVPKITALPDSLDNSLKKIALQKGLISPKDLGLVNTDVETPESNNDKLINIDEPGKLPRGRPPGSKDTQKRTPKTFRPKIKAALQLWANEAQSKIQKIIRPKFLKMVHKNNLRQLTNDEVAQLEKLNFCVLLNTMPFSDINNDNISLALNKTLPNDIYLEYLKYIDDISKQINRPLTMAESRNIISLIYTSIYEDQL